MEKLLEKAFGYIDKLLSPYQVWLTVLLVSVVLLFFPILELDQIAGRYKGWISLAFVISVVVLGMLIFKLIYKWTTNFFSVRSGNLNDEEKMILFMLINYPYRRFDLDSDHQSVISLAKRNIVKVSYHPCMHMRYNRVYLEKYPQWLLKRKIEQVVKAEAEDFIKSISKQPLQRI